MIRDMKEREKGFGEKKNNKKSKKEEEMKKHWNLGDSDLPQKKSTVSLIRSERFENVLSESLLRQARLLCFFPNVFGDFSKPWFPLKLHFKPFDRVPMILLENKVVDQELLKIYYQQIKIHPCISAFKDFFPTNEIPNYLDLSCPLCNVESPAIRYVFYGCLLDTVRGDGVNFSFRRRVLISFRSTDLSEILGLGGVLTEDSKEALFTVIGLKPLLENYKLELEEIARLLNYHDQFYMLVLKFENMDSSYLWSLFSPFYREVISHWYVWEPLLSIIPRVLHPFLQNKDKFLRLVEFYKLIRETYDSVSRSIRR